MGLLSAINNAVSGLSANQQNLNVLSQNISNANTANYSNEVVNQKASYSSDGEAQGVAVSNIVRTVDDFLNAQVQTQTSTNSSASTVQSYYTQIESLLGQPGTTNSIDQGITTFFTAVQNAANSPSATAQTTVVNAASSAASQISGLASSLYSMQSQADSEVGSSISSINADLQSLQGINLALERASATKQSIAGLQDQRDAAVADIAQYINVTPSYGQDGEVSLNTANGITLISPTSSSKLTYTPATGAQTFINNNNLSAIQVQSVDSNGNNSGNPITIATGGPASGVTTSITGGKLQGLLNVRDSVIPNVLNQLDQLAASLRDQVNAINNSGTSSPPPNSYTGTRLISGNSTSAYSGTVQIAVLDANGNAITSPYADETNGVAPLNLNLGTLDNGSGAGVSSVDNIINSINQYYGTPQNKLELGGLNNVQLAVASNTIPDSTGKLDLAFNLNNLSSSSANFYVTGVTVKDSTGATITSNPTSTIPSVALSASATYKTNGTDTVQLTTNGTNTLTNGQTIYLPPPSGTPVTGLASSALGGFFTVSNVSGNTFDITVAGASAATTGTYGASGISAVTNYATVAAGQTLNTRDLGTISADVSSNPSPYYTVTANIATIDASGNPITSTVSYQVTNNQSGVSNNLIGASSQTGNGTIVIPTSTQPIAVASLVDANGNPLSKINGSYGTQQGYLKITAASGTQTIAINQENSMQLGTPAGGSNITTGTNQGFSQYFGLNNFFNVNSLTATGDTLRNSALNLAVTSRIATNPSLVSTGVLAAGNAPASATAAPNYTYQLSSGDNSISQKLAALSTGTVTFNAAGGLPTASTTFAQYAGQIIANTSTNSANATSIASDSQTLLTGFTSRAQAVSGVNLDQELANTVIYQNAYTASTRVITVVSTLFTELMGIIQ